jgi:hypothetical protein
MKNLRTLSRLAAATIACLIASVSTAHAAGQKLLMRPNADESSMIVIWGPPIDDFGPRPTCQMLNPIIEVSIDGRQAAYLTRHSAQPAPINSGACYQWTIPAAWTNKIQTGTWRATVTTYVYSQLTVFTPVNACSSQQGKQPMYWTSYAPLTDNFYTTKVSDRDIAINLGFSYQGVPFSMPMPNGYDMDPFFRYYKGAPQYEHFYSASLADQEFVEANGWTYEGVEGYIFSVAKPGTVPLYRYAYFNSANSDLQHLYSLSSTGPIGQPGWTADGVVGYVCPQ